MLGVKAAPKRLVRRLSRDSLVLFRRFRHFDRRRVNFRDLSVRGWLVV